MKHYIYSYTSACVFNTYILKLALEVCKVITKAPVLRQQLTVLSILGAHSCLNLPPLSQCISQITLFLLVPKKVQGCWECQNMCAP